MKKVIAKIDFVLNGKRYLAGDEIEITDIDKISKLNEKGFIEPLTYKDIVLLTRNNKEMKEEEEWH